MKAIGLIRYLPIDNPDSLIDIELPQPVPSGRDLLIRIEAVSVNPVDTKIRRSKGLQAVETPPRVLGWDAAGVVEAVGPQAVKFRPGDPVYYAGSIARSGANAQFHLVDERIVGHKPASLDFAAASALPLTAITAWEAFFDRLGIDRHGGNRGQSLLIIGGGGGVGSIGIQLAKLAGLVVIATASRPESRRWCQELGADHVVDHRDLKRNVAAAGFETVDFIANFNNTDHYWDVMADLIRPQGRICSIVENEGPLDLGRLKNKSATFVWEFMFTRAAYQTPDIEEQGRILDEIAVLVEGKQLKTTVGEQLSPINALHLRAAHAKLESGTAVGKIVLSGWA